MAIDYVKHGLFPRKEYKDASLDKIDSRASKELQMLCKKHLQVDAEVFYADRANLYLCGSYRIGKTWMFHAIAKHIIEVFKDNSVYFITMPDLQRYFQSNAMYDSFFTWRNFLGGRRVLMIDDLGQEYRGSGTGFIETEIERFLRWRFNMGKITYLGSNALVDPDNEVNALSKVYGESFGKFIESQYIILNITDDINIGELIRNDSLRKRK